MVSKPTTSAGVTSAHTVAGKCVPARSGVGGHRTERTSVPDIYNIAYDPRDETTWVATKARVPIGTAGHLCSVDVDFG